ncbi:hypothetical protein O6H91_07G018400 [Diphasiastrum complanatum]|uniref:Uncharacterized protein n=1 Tax=Diphasiastrum complanatum TaxID=34168 RepID=A0ACC2D2Z8_DIPCM|nr:hypothetical protein O6H91_07G018400 [Diphasiastrum complanatum]
MRMRILWRFVNVAGLKRDGAFGSSFAGTPSFVSLLVSRKFPSTNGSSSRISEKEQRGTMVAYVAPCMPRAAASSSPAASSSSSSSLCLSEQPSASSSHTLRSRSLITAVAYNVHTSDLCSLRICNRIMNLPPLSAASSDATAVANAHDAGEKEVKLWGGRFKETMTPAVEKFSESVSFDKKLYKDDLAGSRAHASMLSKQGLISEHDLEVILQGIDEIERQIEAGNFMWRADREDVHMNIEAALIDLVGESAKKLHTARSRNDQVVTDVRLWCRRSIDQIINNIIELQVTLVNLAANNKGLVVPGYTHLQRAQPLLLQHLLLAYVEQLERDAGRLNDCRARLNYSPLGSCALAGTGLPIDRFATAKALGFIAPLRNSFGPGLLD